MASTTLTTRPARVTVAPGVGECRRASAGKAEGKEEGAMAAPPGRCPFVLTESEEEEEDG